MGRMMILVMGLLAAGTTGVKAQEAARDSASVRELRATLRNVNSAQEVYYSRHNAYATEFSQLGLRPEVVPEGVTVVIRRADTRGWAGEATHSGLEGQSCVLEMGASAGDPVVTRRDRLVASERPGRVRCDGDPTGS